MNTNNVVLDINISEEWLEHFLSDPTIPAHLRVFCILKKHEKSVTRMLNVEKVLLQIPQEVYNGY
jgi:hypothetical protein